ncbi:TPA: hypothetical protein ACT9JI_001797 [Legionella pneumophila]
MLKKIALTSIITICVMSVSHAAVETYLCIASKATGFHFNKKTKNWENENFNVVDVKYIVEKIDGSWRWRKFNLNAKGTFPCKKAILDAIMCVSPDFPIFTFKFNSKTMRYVYSQIDDYPVNDGSYGTPYVEIGTCSPVNLK